MADHEQLTLLKMDVESWNAWRASNPSVEPGLAGADLSKADLRGADLCRANLREADLSG
jgi:uncharacterized protein YjbI with pentapeptide repeats